MIEFEVKGVIFDVDDTLLDNKPGNPGGSLHERSQIDAIRTIGREYGIQALELMTLKESLDAFLTAPVHTHEAAIWNMMENAGLISTFVTELEIRLVAEIVALKDNLHQDILLTDGEPLPGAIDFVQSLSDSGLKDKLAIASSASRREVDIFFGKTGLSAFFPPERIMTKESVDKTKPHPEVFHLAFKSLKLPEDDRLTTLVIEDDPKGISGARKAGMQVCAITTRFNRDELMSLDTPPHMVVDSYAELSEEFGLKTL